MSEIIVVGGGAAGIAAAHGALDAGADNVYVIEREEGLGGILRQCIHDGFGLSKYKKSMTGPEYAAREIDEIITDKRFHQKTCASVTDIRKAGKGYLVCIQSPEGLIWQKADSVVFATGCREKTRGMLMLPGSRPTGVYTAGLMQKLVNIQNILPGRKIVVLGSGDIGLIMARRLHLEGAEIMAVLEVMKDSGGLSRNIRQCLQDFDIPLYTSCTVSKIIGKNRVEAVEVCDVDDHLRIIPDTAWRIACDTLILSAGLIPENDVLVSAGACVNDKKQTIKTDSFLQTTLEGIFACGNSRCVHDLVDRVSEEGYYAGRNAAAYARGKNLIEVVEKITINAEKGIPQKKDIFCILCPKGCRIETVQGNNRKLCVTGNKCPRGIQFAEQEMTEPMRIVTTTVKDDNGKLIPVRSSGMIPINKMVKYVEGCKEVIFDKNSGNIKIALENFPDVIVCR